MPRVSLQGACGALLRHQVNCEGFDYPEDPYILGGSCQLIFALRTPHGNAWLGSIFGWVVVALIAYTIFNALFDARSPNGESSIALLQE